MNNDELPSDFDPKTYLEINDDVRIANVDPVVHYLRFGRYENRVYRHIAGIPSALDQILHANPMTKRSSISSHENIWNWIAQFSEIPNLKVLEIGSRSVQSDSLWRSVIPNCDYTGIDILPGKNVDIIGDAHELSELFEHNTFDLIICFAVFEHLAMPWIVAEEISKVLAPSGHVVIETHFSFSEHELPWHFFQFNSNALETMFCPELGFSVVDSGLDTPMIARFAEEAAPYLQGRLIRDLYCHSSLIARKNSESSMNKNDGGFDWRGILKRLNTESMYPIESDLLLREDKTRTVS